MLGAQQKGRAWEGAAWEGCCVGGLCQAGPQSGSGSRARSERLMGEFCVEDESADLGAFGGFCVGIGASHLQETEGAAVVEQRITTEDVQVRD